MNKIIAILIFILILLSCNNKENKNNSKNYYTEYYDNNKIKIKEEIKNGILHGKYWCYYQNGILKEEGQYLYGYPHGKFNYYNKNGKLYLIEQFVIEDDTIPILNQVIYFNNNGDTLKAKSNYFTLHSKSDTINFGEEYILKIKLDAPYLGQDMYVGIYEGEMVRIKVAKNFIAEYKITALKFGKQKISGFIADCKDVETDSGKFTDKRYMYFEKEFFVEPFWNFKFLIKE